MATEEAVGTEGHVTRAAQYFQRLAIGIGLSLGTAIVPASAQGPVEGVWRAHNKAEVTIAPCGPDLCGNVTRLAGDAEPVSDNGPTLTGAQGGSTNGATSQLSSALGLRVLVILTQTPNGIYEGQIYNALDGQTYEGRFEVIDRDTLKLSGCVLFGVVCRSENWVRVSNSTAALAE